MALGNKHLDDKIREALENLTPEYDTSNWDLFEQRLNEEDILNPTESNDALVDDLVIQKLSNFSFPATADWNLFEEKLDAAETSEIEAIDQLAYQNLHRYEAPYQASHWQIMLQRLEEEFTLRGKLYKYKVAEVALMLLLIFTIINIQPLDSFKVIFKKNDKGIEAEQPGLIPGIENAKDLNENAAETDKSVVERPIAANSTFSSEAKEAFDEVESDNSKKLTEQNALETINQLLAVAEKKQRGEILIPDNAEEQKLKPIASENNSTLKNLANQKAVKENQTLPMAPSLMALEISLLDNGNPEFVLTEPRIEKRKPKWRLGVFTAMDVNHVYTPYDQFFGTPEYTSIASGYGGGISIAMNLLRLGIETGGLYSFKRYVPQNGTFSPKHLLTENFEGVQLDMLQVPLNFQYHFINKGKWRLYMTGGATLNMLLSPVYEFTYRFDGPWGQPAPLPPEEPCDQCLSNVKDFPRGILEGGSFKENAYGTANLGMGMERYVSPRWSVFIQPTYQHYFTKKGVGPNDDKIYSMSVFLGTKVTIK